MRVADCRELRDLHGQTPDEAMEHLAASQGPVYSGRYDGRLVCMFGCVQPGLVGLTGIPWLLGTDELTVMGRYIARYTKSILHEDWRKRHRLLFNVVDARNTLAVSWLRRIGFTLAPAQKLPNGALAQAFWMKGDG
jgi:hypothetical protein